MTSLLDAVADTDLREELRETDAALDRVTTVLERTAAQLRDEGFKGWAAMLETDAELGRRRVKGRRTA